MKLTIALLLMIVCAGPARAEWPAWNQPSKGEVIALGAAEVLIALDCAQTVKGSRQPNRFDMNPVIGRSGPARAAAICAVGGVLTAALWYAAPSKVRYIVVGTIGAGEIASVTNNFVVGLGFGF